MRKLVDASQHCRLETLESRLLWSAAPTTALASPAVSPPAGANLPPGVSNGVAEPVTIQATAGTVYAGPVGRIKSTQLPSNTKVLATIDWGDGQSSTGYVAKLSTGTLLITGKHTWKYGGTYAVIVTAWGVPVAPPGGVVPAIAYPLPTIRSKAVVAGNPAPQPFRGTGVTLNLTAGKAFNGSVGSFQIASLPTLGVLSASIDWGDGTSSAGVITKSANGGYVVGGTHTYRAGGTFPIKTTVSVGPSNGPGPQPLFPSRILGTIDSKAIVAPTVPVEQGTATLVNGLLTVRGTSLADKIDITQTSAAAGAPIDSIFVRINNQTFTFRASQVSKVEVYGRGGADDINLHGDPPPTPIPVSNASTALSLPIGVGLRVAATVYGGWGNDTILGGNAADVLYGGVGNDTLNGGVGKDKLFGDDDDDSLIASPGLDSAYGGAGFDVAVIIGTGVPPPPNSPPPVFYNFGYIAPDVEVVAIPP